MNRSLRTLISPLFALVLAGGCAVEPPGELVQSTKTRARPDVTAPERDTFSRGRHDFAFELYRAAAAAPDGPNERGNLFFSPHSISLALGMTWAGARGDTASEMKDVLSFDLGDRTHVALNDLDLALAAAAGDNFELRILNQLFGDKGEPFKAEFLDLCAEQYGAGLRLLDFETAPEPARTAINDWVKAATKDRIKDLIPQGSITNATRLVLANAIYFNAKWLTPFDKNQTRDRAFNLSSGMQIQAPSMLALRGLPYAAGDRFQAVELPYRGERAALLVIVPEQGRLAEIEARLDAGFLAGIVSAMTPKQVELSLPRFQFEARLPLKKLLQTLGMNKAFDPDVADFSGMSTPGLFLTDALHKAFVRLDEEGTEAAAATAIVAGRTSVPISDVKLDIDRPFLVVLRDRTTSAILFIGRVADPR